jgi:serine/threonine protein kinase
LEKRKSRHQQLVYEAKLYKHLNSVNPSTSGLPSVYWYGTEGENNILVMDLLGASLEDLLTRQRRPFSVKTVVMLGE